jgi:hypothetical protein
MSVYAPWRQAVRDPSSPGSPTDRPYESPHPRRAGATRRGDGGTIVITIWPDHATFDASIATPSMH